MKREEEIKCPKLQKTYLKGFLVRDEKHPQNSEYDAIEDFKGLRKERHCTEIYCLYIFIAFNIMIFGLAGFIMKDINFNRLLYGQDFRGDYCGIKTLESKTYVYWPDPIGWGVNVKACVQNCPTSNGEERCLYNEFHTEYVEDYCLQTYATKPVRAYCIPTQNAAYREIIDKQIHSWSNFFINVATDLLMLEALIGISLAAALVFSILNAIFLNVYKWKINRVWFIVTFLVMILECAGCGYMFYLDIDKVNQKECQDEISGGSCAGMRKNFLFAMVGGCGLIAVYSILKLLFGFPKLLFNFNSMEILAAPIRRVFVFIVPFAFSLIQIAVIGITMVLFTLFMTSGYNINVPTGPEFYMPEVRKTLMTWYAYYGSFLLFFLMYLYVSFFISVQRTLVATLIAQWYFSKTQEWLKGSVINGYKVVCKHIGTLFYHGFIIALIWPFRKFSGYFMHKFNQIKYANGFHLFFIKICTCCIRFHETKWKYTYSQALYQTTLFGDNFTIAGIKLYYLRYRNYGRYKGFETKFGMFSYYSNLLVSFTAAAVVYYFICFYSDTMIKFDFSKLEFPQLAPIACWVFSAFICRGYNNLIDYSYEVMVFCFMADEEMFQGDQRFAKEKVTEYFNLHGKESEKAYLKNVQNLAMEKRAAKDTKKKKKGKSNKVHPKGQDGENSSDDELDEEDLNRARGEYVKSMMEKKRKEEEEREKEREERRKAEEEGDQLNKKKKKIELHGDTVAGNLLKMVQRQAVATTAQDDKIRIARKKSEEEDDKPIYPKAEKELEKLPAFLC